jgi:anti-sigma-K factor RskA
LRAPRRRPTRRIAALAAAAVLAAVLAVGFDRLRNNDDGPPTVTDLADAALLDPDSTVINLDHPDTGTPAARIVIDASGHAYLRLDSLAPLPPDEAYQLWRTEGTSPVSLAVLGPDTPNVVPVSVPAGTARLAITREPDQGSPVPTGPLVAAGTANA